MKKTIITLAFLLCAVAVFGQNKQEVIRLKNGSPVQADLQSDCAEKGIYNPQPVINEKDGIVLGFELFIITFAAK